MVVLLSRRRCELHHVHAFGLSNRWLLKNFYFPSADATTWLFQAQRFAATPIGDLRHLISTEAEAIAARTFKEAWRAMRLETNSPRSGRGSPFTRR